MKKRTINFGIKAFTNYSSLFSMVMYIFIFVTLSGLVLSGLQAQMIYSGPAFGQIAGGVQVSTTSFEGMQQLISIESEKNILNHYWERMDPPLADDIYNRTPASAPLGSNLLFDPSVTMEMMQQLHAPFTVLDFSGGMDPGNTIPPDPDLAVGPNHVITVQNAPRIRIFDKMGNLVQLINANAWFSTTIANPDPFDCHIIYDHFAERWVQLWLNLDEASQTSYWLLSVSDDSDPMGTWCNFAFPSHFNGNNNAFNWGDYPKIGYDQQAIYVSGRQFGFSGGFNYSKVRIIPKSQLYDPNCGPVDYTDFWNFRDPNNSGQVVDGPPIAANHMDSTNTAYLVVDSPYNTSTFITLWEITDPLSTTPVVTATNIPTAAALRPPDGDQLGGGTPRLDSGRRSYRRAIYKDGNIWTACPIAGGTSFQYAFARYVRLDVNSKTALEDVALGANGFYYLYPTCLVDGDDNLTMVFTRSGLTEYAAAAYTGRRSTDPPGLAPSVVFKEGESNYIKTFSGTRNRWGDYMGIALDPVNPNTIWGFVEYAASPENTFGIWVGAFNHQYSLSGIVKNRTTSNPIEFANLQVLETGQQIVTDSTGSFSFASFGANVTVNLAAFAYQDTSYNISLTSYSPDTLDLLMAPQIEAVFSGRVFDAISGDGIEAEIEFYAEGNPYPGPYQVVNTDTSGNYSLNTIIGNYDLVVNPESPYPNSEYDSLLLPASGLNFNIELNPADVMLVDDDQGEDYENYFFDALTQLSKTYHHWESDVKGVSTSAHMAEFPGKKVLWFTGDGTDSTLNPIEQAEILSHLGNGGKLFLTGQNIAEQLDGTPFMDSLGVDFATNIAMVLVTGVAGDIGDGLVFPCVGSGGANNQTSKDQLAVLDSLKSRSVFIYGTAASSTAGAAIEFDSAKAVFLGFGWEAICTSELRESTLDVVLSYLDQPTSIKWTDLSSSIPEDYELFQNYPNPFNPETTIRFSVPRSSEIEIVIFNSLGQKVRQLTDKFYEAGFHQVIWDGKDDLYVPVSSGIYFYQITNLSDFTQIRKLLLLK